MLPGGGVGGEVFTTSIISFLNIYNTVLVRRESNAKKGAKSDSPRQVARLILTWFPNPPQVILSPLATLADPYLNAFRGLIPPIGGMDLSPILGFTVLNLFQGAAAALPAEMEAARKLRQPKLAK